MDETPNKKCPITGSSFIIFDSSSVAVTQSQSGVMYLPISKPTKIPNPIINSPPNLRSMGDSKNGVNTAIGKTTLLPLFRNSSCLIPLGIKTPP